MHQRNKLNDVASIDINRLYITIIGSLIDKGVFVFVFVDYKIIFSAMTIKSNVDWHLNLFVTGMCSHTFTSF
jgi:hypothetical protein